ncbi:MAG: UDP-N-acetylmuramoyl-tripeptide--D-alanyl-D-alanine ligase [Deltaproteobacteria bacterium]|nr:UDP-N-acetylmuramoyl-tripeptide--D-alanyl-D-alanine ligase [Deltaproteobacteria bacterium]
MMTLKVSEIAAVVGGIVAQGSPEAAADAVFTDSRSPAPGGVFFALAGPRFDGHAFVKDVFDKGAAAAVVSRTEGIAGLVPGLPLIVVDDTLRALGALACFVRGAHDAPVVAISGSAGKTTTKEMVAAILGRTRKVLKTEGNRNNLVGLPLTLLGLTNEHAAAVVELGISEMGEMERLVEMARPDVAVLTNIGRAHLESLGSIEGVAMAKGPLFANLGEGAVKAVNLDDGWVVRLAGQAGHCITYSAREAADVRVREASPLPRLGGIRVAYDVRGKTVKVVIPTPSATAVINGAAAIAASLPFGIGARDIEEGLASFSNAHGRMDIVRAGGVTILDDTYNANPASMASAMRTLAAAEGRKVAVLGEMLELGDASSAEHRELGRLAAGLGIDVVAAIGPKALDVTEGARDAGMSESRLHGFRNKKEALAGLRFIVREGDAVLVKGSRGAALEEVVEGLKGLGEAAPAN